MAWEDSNTTPGAEATRSGLPSSAPASSSGSTEWLRLAKDAFSQSTTYFDNNVQKQIEDGLRLFDSRHPRDSKYNSDAYKYRSRLFRPKTRSTIRKHEAAAWQALFSSPDFANIDPVDGEDDAQVTSAGINKQLLQYRLNKSLPWSIIAIGALQDAAKVGICASFNYWVYKTTEVEETKQADFFGEPLELKVKTQKVREDRPCVELLPVENLRFHPAAKWYDVVGTSPYLIIQIPMYLRDALDRMETGYGKGEPEWKKLSKQDLLQARITDSSPVQQARESRREDPQAQTSPVNEFDLIMVHLNFIKVDDECYVYYTLKDKELLSDPRPLSEVFLHDEIPVTVGFCLIETHKTMPGGLSNLGMPLQVEGNEIVNQRLDNVKYVLNKRSLVRRGSNVDIEGMLRNVPGGITMVNDIERDVKTLETPDVTGSAYQEQDRVNADMDDLVGGGLNSSSVSTNRRMNETVGGMRLIAQGANALSEYTINVWIDTWYLPTLRQLVKLEQHYESDEVILALAAKKAGMYQKFQMTPDLDMLLKAELTVTVNAGMGATDPQQRFQSFMQCMGAYTSIVQSSQMMGDMDLVEVRKELFGLGGWKDSARFFGKTDPRWQQAQMMVQQAQGMAKEIVDGAKDRILRREIQLERRQIDQDMKELSLEHKEANIENNLQLKADEQAAEFRLKEREQDFEQARAQAEAEHKMRLAEVEAAHERLMAKQKAQDEARIEAFKARMNAAVQQFEATTKKAIAEQKAETDRRIAASKMKAKARKGKDGTWEIERS